MAIPLETQIVNDFQRRLDGSSAVPSALVDVLVSFAGADKVPTSDAILIAIKTNVGDQSV